MEFCSLKLMMQPRTTKDVLYSATTASVRCLVNGHVTSPADLQRRVQGGFEKTVQHLERQRDEQVAELNEVHATLNKLIQFENASVNNVVARLGVLDDPGHGDDGPVSTMSCNGWNRVNCSRRRWIWFWIQTSLHAWLFMSLGIF